MRQVVRVKPRRIPSFPSLIGWLSLCLLAAAVGHTLDANWQPIWARMGAFGLVAAVGLGALEKSRADREDAHRDQLMQTRFESGLARFNQHSAAVDAISEAFRRLEEHALRARRGAGGKSAGAKRTHRTHLLEGFPLEIMPVEEQGGALDLGMARSISGSVRQISSRAVSFDHDELFATRIVLLTFQLGDQGPLSFVVDVMWTEKSDGEFASGGTVLAAGVPSSEDREPELASASDA